jgi:hypothetical protein
MPTSSLRAILVRRRDAGEEIAVIRLPAQGIQFIPAAAAPSTQSSPTRRGSGQLATTLEGKQISLDGKTLRRIALGLLRPDRRVKIGVKNKRWKACRNRDCLLGVLL